MFTETKISFYNPRFMTIQWQYSPASLNNKFYIYQSESPESGFDLLSEELTGDTTEFSTDKINLYNLTRNIYIKIKCVEDSGNTVWSKTMSNFPSEKHRYAANIMERRDLELRRLNGIKTALYIKRTYGIRCPACWDPIANRTRKSKCPECYNTGWYKGYHDPIIIWVSYPPVYKAIGNAGMGAVEAMSTMAWTNGYPLITPGSVLIEMNESARHWVASQIQFKEIARFPVKQIVKLEELRKDAIEWKLPIPEEGQCQEHSIWKR